MIATWKRHVALVGQLSKPAGEDAVFYRIRLDLTVAKSIITYSFSMLEAALLHCVAANSVRSIIGQSFIYRRPENCSDKPSHLSVEFVAAVYNLSQKCSLMKSA